MSGMNKAIHVISRCSGAPLRHAIRELGIQAAAHGFSLVEANFWNTSTGSAPVLVMGEKDDPLAARLAVENGICLPVGPESLAIHSCKITDAQSALLIAGGDTAGLMYGIYELADRLRCEGPGVLARDLHIEDHPDNAVRGVDRYVMNHNDEEWLYSAQFWDYFLKNLAKNRFNRFTLITGFDTAYMTPPYPFFCEIPGFENVRVKGVDAAKRKQNLDALKMIAEKCAEYGVLFSFSSWQQNAWTGNQNMLVENIPDSEADFTRFCTAGLAALLDACPGIDVVQFRVNNEAGIKLAVSEGNNTHEAFWFSIIDVVADRIAASGKAIKLDMRAKGITRGMIDYALSKGLDLSLPTKYWCEHAALPYHIPRLRTEELKHITDSGWSARYSYCDFLKKPRWYNIIFRLWNYGSTNLLLWGDPDYGERFSKSLAMVGASGFEINSPLSLKGGMEALAEKPWGIHRDRELVTYRWEDERYWACYLVFGRYGYSAAAAPEIIEREFIHRYGEAGSTILDVFKIAGKLLPLVTTIHFPVHPSLCYWPELYPGAALFGENNYERAFGKIEYAAALPGDEELFQSIAAYADSLESGAANHKYNPFVWYGTLHQFADSVRSLLAKAGCTEKSEGEKRAVWVDCTMLSFIADFHAWKSRAAYNLYMFKKNSAAENLAGAYREFSAARFFWAELSALGDKYYCHDLQFNAGSGRGRSKNWRERLEKEVDADLNSLKQLLEKSGIDPDQIPSVDPFAFGSPAAESALDISWNVPETWNPGADLTITAKTGGSVMAKELILHYRHTDHTEGEYHTLVMEGRGHEYSAAIPAAYFKAPFDVIVYVSAVDAAGNTTIYPGVYHPEYASPYVIIRVTR